MKRDPILHAAVAAALLVAAAPVRADRAVRSGSRQNVNASRSRNTNVNANRNVNVNANRNVNVNVDRDVHVHGGYYGGGYYGGGYYGGCCYHDHNPVATAVAVTAATMVTAAVVGSIVHTLPSGCSTVIVNGFAYQQCGSTWYQPQISGSSTTYIVVNAPR